MPLIKDKNDKTFFSAMSSASQISEPVSLGVPATASAPLPTGRYAKSLAKGYISDRFETDDAVERVEVIRMRPTTFTDAADGKSVDTTIEWPDVRQPIDRKIDCFGAYIEIKLKGMASGGTGISAANIDTIEGCLNFLQQLKIDMNDNLHLENITSGLPWHIYQRLLSADKTYMDTAAKSALCYLDDWSTAVDSTTTNTDTYITPIGAAGATGIAYAYLGADNKVDAGTSSVRITNTRYPTITNRPRFAISKMFYDAAANVVTARIPLGILSDFFNKFRLGNWTKMSIRLVKSNYSSGITHLGTTAHDEFVKASTDTSIVQIVDAALVYPLLTLNPELTRFFNDNLRNNVAQEVYYDTMRFTHLGPVLVTTGMVFHREFSAIDMKSHHLLTHHAPTKTVSAMTMLPSYSPITQKDIRKDGAPLSIPSETLAAPYDYIGAYRDFLACMVGPFGYYGGFVDYTQFLSSHFIISTKTGTAISIDGRAEGYTGKNQLNRYTIDYTIGTADASAITEEIQVLESRCSFGGNMLIRPERSINMF